MLDDLYHAVDKLFEGFSPAQLKAYALEMSERYRHGVPYDRQVSFIEKSKAHLFKPTLPMSSSSAALTLKKMPIQRELQSEMEYLAYLVVRQPATFAALQKIFQALKPRLVKPFFSSVLDVGSGPGTALWALSEHVQWELATALELQPIWIDFARKLWQQHPNALSVDWKLADIRSSLFFPSSSYDLVMASYCLNEVESVQETIDSLWSMTRQLLIWVEPGRSDCFEKMRAFRKRVIDSGTGEIVAPCTGQGRCPFSPFQEVEYDFDEIPLDDSAWQNLNERQVGPGWCHFSVRLERRALHRALKQATLNYEDEKFCYLIIARKGELDLQEPLPVTGALSRVMEDPKVRSGHVKMALCDSEHLTEEVVTKTDKPAFKLAKKVNWGDLWPQLSKDHEDLNGKPEC